MSGISILYLNLLCVFRYPVLKGGVLLLTLLVASYGYSDLSDNAKADTKSDEFLIVDCLLPGQVRKLGQRMNYLSPRRPIKTSATDCEIRGGEYVAYDRANYGTALKIWLPQAKEGDPEAQTYVGEIYEKGLGLKPDYKVAAFWYQKAVQQNYSRAAINLGNLYETGLGVEQDQQKALNLYRMASGMDDELLFASSLVSTHVPKENFESLQSQLEDEKKQTSKLKNDIVQLNSEIQQRSLNLNKAEKELEATAEQLAELTESIPDTSESDENEKALQKEMDVLQLEKNLLKEQLATLQAQNQALSKNSKNLNALLAGKEQLQNENQKALIRLQEDMARSKQQLDSSQTVVNQLQAELKSKQENQNSSQSTIQELEQRLAANNASLSEAKIRYAQLQSSSKAKQKEIEQAKVSMKQQAARFKTEKEDFQKKQYQLQKQLTDNQWKLTEAKHRLLLTKAALKLERSENRRIAEQKFDETTKKQLEERDRRLRQLAENLSKQTQLVSKQKKTIQSLESQVDEFAERQALDKKQDKQPLLVSETAQASLTTAPRIEILDPPVVLQRSIPTVELSSRSGMRQVVGKVTAGQGIHSFTINGEPVELSSNNLFSTTVKLDNNPERVNIVVVDKAGKRAAAVFDFVGPAEVTGASTESPPEMAVNELQPFKLTLPKKQFGNYHALIIGNNDYQHFSTLMTAINDAKETEKLLRTRYNFKTQLLLDADRYTILSTLNGLRETLTDKDNLLIYYAGHGVLDEETKRGYWLPVDAYPDNDVNWISNDSIADILNAIHAKHIFVVADSCFSGTLSPTPLARIQTDVPSDIKNEWIKIMTDTRARITLTSGGLEPVRDDAGNGHSLFATAFLDVLRDNETLMEGYSLYYQIMLRMNRLNMAVKSSERMSQIPQYSPIHLAGHESGEFFFVPL